MRACSLAFCFSLTGLPFADLLLPEWLTASATWSDTIGATISSTKKPQEVIVRVSSITQSAGYLYIHRHTLLKRLDKIREISGLNLEDWYTRLYMSINLLFHDYFIY